MSVAAPSVKRASYAAYNPVTGKYIDIATGQPFHGTDPRTGQNFDNGTPSAGSAASAQTVNAPGIGPINPNDPTQRYRAVDVVKSPDVAAATSDLMATFKKNADQALKGFGDYLNDFRSDIASARKASATATDTTGTENALRTAATQYGQNLTGANQQYQTALSNAAAGERGVVSQAQADLPLYDQALQNVENQQLAKVSGEFSKYKLGSGTPTTPSSYDAAILARAAAEAAAPIELQKVQQRYNILGNLALPVEQQIGGQNINYAGNFLPTVAGSRYGADTGTATAIQSLRQQVAGMSMDNAIRFMQASGVPNQVMQQVLSGQIGQLGGISGLEDMSRYRGLQDVLGAYPSQPLSFDMSLPQSPVFPTRYPTSRIPPTLASSGNAPIQVSPNLDVAQPGLNMSASDLTNTVGPGMNYNPDMVLPGMNYGGSRYAGNVGSQTPASAGGLLSPDEYAQLMYQLQYGG